MCAPCDAGSEWFGQVRHRRANAEPQSGGGHQFEACQDAGCDVIWHGELLVYSIKCVVRLYQYV